jgi:hypothetical protein
MMKSLLISLLVIAVLVVIALRVFIHGPEAPEMKTAPSERFLNQCRPVASTMPRPEVYCRCLWERGVRSVGETISSPAGQKVATECSAR